MWRRNPENRKEMLMVVQSVGTGNEHKAVERCLSCKPENQAEFAAEINIHFRGLKNIDNPGVLFLSQVVVCLVCGSSRFSTPETELALLARGIPTRETFSGSAEC
jgi:hypothetical protein